MSLYGLRPEAAGRDEGSGAYRNPRMPSEVLLDFTTLLMFTYHTHIVYFSSASSARITLMFTI